MPFENACLSQEQVILFRGGNEGENVIIPCDEPKARLDYQIVPFSPSISKSNLLLECFGRTGKGVYAFVEEPDLKKSQREVSIKPIKPAEWNMAELFHSSARGSVGQRY